MNSLLKYLPNATSKSFLTVAIFLGLTLDSKPQNLVPNGGFEEVINCPNTFDGLHFDCAHWFKSILLPGTEWYNSPSPDWFHTCSEQEVLTPPLTALGFQAPFEGDSYSGLHTIVLSILDYREVIGVELLEPLQLDEAYSVSLRLSRGFSQISHMSSNNLGVKFSTTGIHSSSEALVNNFSHYKIDTLVTDTSNWSLIQFEFVPDSAYNFLHIGNFFIDDETLYEDQQYPADRAYYFVDDVSVTKLLYNSTSNKENNLIRLFPNPCQINFVISEVEKLSGVKKVEVQNARGQRMFQFDNPILPFIIETHSWESGLYFVSIKTKNDDFIRKKIVVL